MRRCKFKLAIILSSFLLLPCLNISAQQGSSVLHPPIRGAAQGDLTVTATVVSSVGLVIGPDGQQKLVVANAADPGDNVSSLSLLSAPGPTPADSPKKVPKKRQTHVLPNQFQAER
jgi:hypothetical protein